jgi:hypothetical protein
MAHVTGIRSARPAVVSSNLDQTKEVCGRNEYNIHRPHCAISTLGGLNK